MVDAWFTIYGRNRSEEIQDCGGGEGDCNRLQHSVRCKAGAETSLPQELRGILWRTKHLKPESVCFANRIRRQISASIDLKISDICVSRYFRLKKTRIKIDTYLCKMDLFSVSIFL